MSAPHGLALYTRTARRMSRQVIGAYSTSFGLASAMLPRRLRTGIADVYALVRVADELVDGPAAEAGLGLDGVRALLDDLESETVNAIRTGFSANLVVHAFAATARDSDIDARLVRPFFASMRMDVADGVALDEPSYRRYIHGSAEVVGEMCLRVFMQEREGLVIDEHLEEGARRLGAAFQKVNFLRDLADDSGRLHRAYIPGLDPRAFDDEDKNAVVEEIARDLAVAKGAIARLPPRSRRATAAAAMLFDRLNKQIREMPAAQLRRSRASVPLPVKVGILASAAAGRGSA
ncbi:squalene/phytoene synthase family protein [Microbacterium sp. MAHUQ-60]|uniref:squalene/phytoene synthase family protein n=1 Tax=unclassified Microbacterium TaxID=2609290 RepID=UPI003606EE47